MANQHKDIVVSDAEFESQFAKASKKGSKRAESGARASAVRYDAKTKRLVIEMENGAAMLVPPELIQGLQGAGEDSLADLRLMANGTQVHWDSLDVQFYVDDLLRGVFGTPKWMTSLRAHLSDIGRKGGSSTSTQKAASSRTNGAKGGRPPRKVA